MLPRASLMKVEFILEVARKDNQFLTDLTNDPYRTLVESGIDLSANETLAVLDIVNNTSISTLSPHLPKAKKHWEHIVTEAKPVTAD